MAEDRISYFTHECGASWSLPGDIPEAKCPNCDVLVLRRPRRDQPAAKPSFDECGFRPTDTPCECGFEESAATPSCSACGDTKIDCPTCGYGMDSAATPSPETTGGVPDLLILSGAVEEGYEDGLEAPDAPWWNQETR